MKATSQARSRMCFACRGELGDAVADLTFEDQDFRIVFQDVPVRICSECGEKLVNGPLGMMIGHVATKLAEAWRPLIADNDAFRGIEIRKVFDPVQFEAQIADFFPEASPAEALHT